MMKKAGVRKMNTENMCESVKETYKTYLCGEISGDKLERIKEKIKERIKDLQKLLIRINRTQNSEKLDKILRDFCDIIRDCTICPLESECKIKLYGCSIKIMCESCPRLRLCVWQNRTELKKDYE
jgi:hypothetical protein